MRSYFVYAKIKNTYSSFVHLMFSKDRQQNALNLIESIRAPFFFFFPLSLLIVPCMDLYQFTVSLKRDGFLEIKLLLMSVQLEEIKYMHLIYM